MPRYFFHVYDDLTALDEDGLDLPDAETAKAQALKGARSIACEQVCEGYLKLHHRVEVVDSAGAPVATITFADAVKVED